MDDAEVEELVSDPGRPAGNRWGPPFGGGRGPRAGLQAAGGPGPPGAAMSGIPRSARGRRLPELIGSL